MAMCHGIVVATALLMVATLQGRVAKQRPSQVYS
jgi:hypothetical protein